MNISEVKNLIEGASYENKIQTLEDICERVAARKCNKACKENLIWAGAFDDIPIVHKKKDKQMRLV